MIKKFSGADIIELEENRNNQKISKNKTKEN